MWRAIITFIRLRNDEDFSIERSEWGMASFPALQTTKLDLIESSDKGRRINPRRFDDLVEHIAGQPVDAHVIVDTGSSAFVPRSTTWSAMRCYSPLTRRS